MMKPVENGTSKDHMARLLVPLFVQLCVQAKHCKRLSILGVITCAQYLTLKYPFLVAYLLINLRTMMDIERATYMFDL